MPPEDVVNRHGALMRPTTFTLRVMALAALGSLSPALSAAPADPVIAEIEKGLDAGAEYLRSSQNPDGGYGPLGKQARVENTSEVGITALVVYALAKHPRKYRPVDGPFLSRAVQFVLSHQQDDGGFYLRGDPQLRNYRTCVVLMALNALDRVQFAEPIRKGQAFIKSEQYDETRGYAKGEHLYYGGIGRSGGLRPDNSNAAYAAEVFVETGLSGSDPVWKKLETFVSRCQNSPTVDPLLKKEGIGTTGDWGFRYQPTDTRGPAETLDSGDRVFSSYGSMTYQGLKSLLYAQVGRDDPRVRGAFEWIARNYTVTENPGMAAKSDPKSGLQGLFYYYHTMAKTLSVLGQPEITDGKGVRHNWARELAAQLLSLQRKEGYWQNESGRFWEDLTTLDTAYAMVTLVLCRDELLRQAKQPVPAADPQGAKEKR
jgi:squalene-hopene/tetraprenyl-beta-curcumene cyclase